MKPVLLVLVAGAVVLLSFLVLAFMFSESQDQRAASCRATLVALNATADTARAGIRPTSDRIPTDISPELAASFRMQLAATKAENRRRAKVVAEVTAAAARLRQSDFCK